MLRKRPYQERWLFVRECLDLDWSLGLFLVPKLQIDRTGLLAVLSLGLERGDASTLRWWLEAVLPGLGVRRLTRALQTAYEERPQQVAKALYWMGNLVEDWREDAELRALIERSSALSGK
jgi:YD repeat-containing protein